MKVDVYVMEIRSSETKQIANDEDGGESGGSQVRRIRHRVCARST